MGLLAGSRVTAPAVLVLGELCADIVVELDGEIHFGQSERVVPDTRITMGSSSAITACGLARLGIGTQIAAVVGDDLLGGFLLDQLAARGVGTSAVRVDPDVPTGTSTILTRPDGDRAILTALGSIGRTTIGDARPEVLDAARHVHVGSYFLQHGLQGELGAWFEARRALGQTTSMDPNDDPDGRWDSDVRSVIAHCDLLFVNEHEACGIADELDPAAAAARILELMPADGHLVLKRGADGAEVHRPGAGLIARAGSPADPRPFVDAIGAGDSLAAGFLAARLRGLDPAGALAVGVKNGTASTRGTGGTSGQLTWAEATSALA